MLKGNVKNASNGSLAGTKLKNAKSILTTKIILRCDVKYFENMKIGNATLIKRKGKDAKGQWVWVVLCSCGKTFEMCYNSLFYARRRGYLSCGCGYVTGREAILAKDKIKYAQHKKQKREKEKQFFCPFRDKLNKEFFQDSKRAKCYSSEFCREKPCITFSHIVAKYTTYRGVNNAIL